MIQLKLRQERGQNRLIPSLLNCHLAHLADVYFNQNNSATKIIDLYFS